MAAPAPTSKARQPLPEQLWIPLRGQVIARISGPGTDRFLQGQFSQDLKSVTLDNSPRAAACNPKGRAYALVRMVRHGEDVLVNLPTALADETLSHLRKYLMLFRGTTMTLEPEARVTGLLGDTLANDLLPDAASTLTEPGVTASIGAHRLIRTQDTAEGLSRFEFWQMEEMAGGQAEAFEPDTRGNEADWEASEIAAGVPWLTPETRESYVPQVLNWQHLDGIHFKKGCYTGQEVIARMHFLGQLKKSLFRLESRQAADLPSPGAGIMGEDRQAGEVVNAVMHTDGTLQMLAVLRHDAARGELFLAGGEVPLFPLPLPYSVTEREKGEPASDT
ncbi:YgfZ/GcvT domain-containing protein [Marinobacter sp.]|uniref:CAF17-like 4Fe-4S cluster assembly/insertion protein YgfZ n=1 Tax=Marinobacter sp. TaxID=50741 RepID=UPI00384A84AD